MARIHDLFIVELAEVIKGYGNDPDVEDPFRLSEFYRFYELPNIAVSRENFEKMRPVEPERKREKWIGHPIKGTGSLSIDKDTCSHCGERFYQIAETGAIWNFCPNCGADMRGGDSNE